MQLEFGHSLVPRPNFSRAPCGLFFGKSAGRARKIWSGDETSSSSARPLSHDVISYDLPYIVIIMYNWKEICWGSTPRKQLIVMWVCSSSKQLVRPPPWALPVYVYRNTVGKEWWDCVAAIYLDQFFPLDPHLRGEELSTYLLSLLICGATEWLRVYIQSVFTLHN